MEFLGVGPFELIFILIIALIVLGPHDMVKAGRTLGRLMRRVVKSPTWKVMQDTSRELRYLPNRLMREAGLEELEEMQKSLPNAQQLRQEFGIEEIRREMSTWEQEPETGPEFRRDDDMPAPGEEPRIAPPAPGAENDSPTPPAARPEE